MKNYSVVFTRNLLGLQFQGVGSKVWGVSGKPTIYLALFCGSGDFFRIIVCAIDLVMQMFDCIAQNHAVYPQKLGKRHTYQEK